MRLALGVYGHARGAAIVGDPLGIGFDAAQGEEVNLFDAKAGVLGLVGRQIGDEFGRLIGQKELCHIQRPLLQHAKGGADTAGNGELDKGKEMAKALGEKLPGTILTTAGGCAAHLASVIGSDRVQEFSQWWIKREIE